ncbi:hypothetical protein [Streptomyces fulvoviolaceus]|uniref:hypothetical protein n=1 Tax=Streptomyces fulvoviolaceus TaxID=285535 RepID=UPI0005B9F353|nr:hypothetical protein [Streptomyces fulvoviolaceus]
MYGRHLALGVAAALAAATVNAAPAPDRPATAAERYGWGDPLPEWSDEFDYGSEAAPAVPDRDKWRAAVPARAGPATAATAAAATSTPGSSAASCA